MPVKLKWPWLGVVIPSLLISILGYGSHFFILRRSLSLKGQILFQCCLTMIWISYYLAIYTEPGRPPSSYQPGKFEWSTFCKKCRNYKPPRAHHCKTCNQCVLMMDHHCPWTLNCVGVANFPHFMRFLFWVIITTLLLLFHLMSRIIFIYKHRQLPKETFEIPEIYFLTVFTPLNSFVLVTISLLFCRCLSNQIFGGRSQIEAWEIERLEASFYSRRLIPLLIQSAKEIYPNTPVLSNELKVRKMMHSRRLRFHDIINFPYDVDPLSNAVNLLGSPLQWLYPFGKPRQNGISFPKNEIAEHVSTSNLEDVFLSLPWPPDGAKHNINGGSSNNVETTNENGEQLIRKRLVENEPGILRTQWENDWGENLADFGVDVDVETE